MAPRVLGSSAEDDGYRLPHHRHERRHRIAWFRRGAPGNLLPEYFQRHAFGVVPGAPVAGDHAECHGGCRWAIVAPSRNPAAKLRVDCRVRPRRNGRWTAKSAEQRTGPRVGVNRLCPSNLEETVRFYRDLVRCSMNRQKATEATARYIRHLFQLRA